MLSAERALSVEHIHKEHDKFFVYFLTQGETCRGDGGEVNENEFSTTKRTGTIRRAAAQEYAAARRIVFTSEAHVIYGRAMSGGGRYIYT